MERAYEVVGYIWAKRDLVCSASRTFFWAVTLRKSESESVLIYGGKAEDLIYAQYAHAKNN